MHVPIRRDVFANFSFFKEFFRIDWARSFIGILFSMNARGVAYLHVCSSFRMSICFSVNEHVVSMFFQR